MIALVSGVWFSNLESAEAISLSMPPAPLVRVQSSYDHPSEVKIAKVIARKTDHISYKSNKEILFLIYLTDPRIASNQQVLKIVKELRGGSWAGLLGSAVFFGIIYTIFILSGTESFVVPPANPGWGLPNNNSYDPPGLVRPADCETQLYAGSPTQSLKTWEDRNQPNPKDRFILVESRPELVIRRGQAKFKTKDHGAIAGLPYSIKANGGTSTPKTEENVDIFMDVVEEVVKDLNSIWFEKGTYQGNTTRELESINVYNDESNRLAIFKRSTGEFVTLCEPTETEYEDLEETHNFGGQDNWFSGQAKNLPLQQNVENEMTPVNRFESDVMGISQVMSINESSSPNEVPNQGFTPINSFENDVLGVTPIDPDWQI